jgi:hypothetical protein
MVTMETSRQTEAKTKDWMFFARREVGEGGAHAPDEGPPLKA